MELAVAVFNTERNEYPFSTPSSKRPDPPGRQPAKGCLSKWLYTDADVLIRRTHARYRCRREVRDLHLINEMVEGKAVIVISSELEETRHRIYTLACMGHTTGEVNETPHRKTPMEP